MFNPAVETELEDNCIPCLKSGKIIIMETQSTFRCVIRSLCFLSAKLELNHYVELPEEFLLSMRDVDYEAPIKCRIQAREGNSIIVGFI